MKNFFYRLAIGLLWFGLINILVFFAVYSLSILNIDEVEPLLLFYVIALLGCAALPFSSVSCFLFPGSGIVFWVILSFLLTLFFTKNRDEIQLRSKLMFTLKVIGVFIVFCILALLLLWGLNNLFFNV